MWYAHHLKKEPSLVAAAKWIAGEALEHPQFHPQVQRALDHAAQPLTRYRCAACGFEARQHFWQCPGVPDLGQLPRAPHRRTLTLSVSAAQQNSRNGSGRG